MRAMAPRQFASPRALASSQIGASLFFSLRWLRLTLRLEIFHVQSQPVHDPVVSGICSLGDNDGIKLSENILASVRANVPYRYEPEE